jgi:hypothetical protein
MALDLAQLVAQAKAKAASPAPRPSPAARIEPADPPPPPPEWTLRALVLCFERWECACGGVGLAPAGLMLYSEHSRLANSTRLVPPRHEAEIPAGLPRRRHETRRVVAMCPHCADALGFVKALAMPDRQAPAREALPPPDGFHAEWLRLRAQTPDPDPTPGEPT